MNKLLINIYSGDEENNYYNDSWEESKIDVEFLCEYVY